jgi:hypothetical protein
MIRLAATMLFLLLAASPASAQFDKFLKGFGGLPGAGLGDAKIGSGLQEALKIGTATPNDYHRRL